MNQPGRNLPRAKPLPENEIVEAELAFVPVISSPKPTAPPPAPAAYDWWLLALLSWVLAFLAFVVGTLVVFLGIRFWVWWVVVATLLGLGYMASLVPLNTWPARAWVKGVATAGLVFTILATIWVGVGVALRVAATPVQVAEAREEFKNLRELPKRLAEEQAARERALREEQKRAAEAERQRLLTVERGVAIERRDEELARRFQRGDDRSPLPEIPPDGPPESMRAQTLPLMRPQPLAINVVTRKSVPSQTALAEPWRFVEDLKLRPWKLAARDLAPGVLWSGENRALLLTRAGKLLEIDALEGIILRELDLGGPCVSFCRSKSELIVARTTPGALLFVDPAALAVTMEIPVATPLEVAAHPEHGLLFVRSGGRYGLAVINARTRVLQHLLTPPESQLLGHENEPQWHPLNQPDSIDQIAAPLPNQFLARDGGVLHRWTIFSGQLTYQQSTSSSSHEGFVTSGDGSLLVTTSTLFACDDLQRAQGVMQGKYYVHTAGIASKKGLIFAADSGTNLRVFSRRGEVLAEYRWGEGRETGRTERIYVTPAEDRLLVFHEQRLYNVELPATLGGSSSSSGNNDSNSEKPQQKLQVAGWTWPECARPELKLVDAAPIPNERAVPVSPGIPSRQLTGGAGLWRWSADGDSLYWLGNDALCRVNAASFKVEQAVAVPSERSFTHLMLSQAGLVAISKQPTRLWVLDPKSLAGVRVIDAPDLLANLRQPQLMAATSPASPLLVGLAASGELQVIDLRTGELTAQVPLASVTGKPEGTSAGDWPPIASLAMSADGGSLFVVKDGVHRSAIGILGLVYEQSSLPLKTRCPGLLSGDGRLIAVQTDAEGTLFFETANLKSVRSDQFRAAIDERSVLDQTGERIWQSGLSVCSGGLSQPIYCTLPETTHSELRLSPDGRLLLAVGSQHAYVVETRFAAAGSAKSAPHPPAVEAAQLIELAGASPFEIRQVDEDATLERSEAGAGRLAKIEALEIRDLRRWFLFSADGRWLYRLVNGKSVKQISLQNVRCEREIFWQSPFFSTARLVWVGGKLGVLDQGTKGRQIWLLDPDNLEPQHVLQIRDSEIVAAAEQSPLLYQVEGDTLTLADLAEAKTLGSWSIVALGTQHAEGLRPNQRLTSIRRLIASSDGSELVVAGTGGTHWLTQSSGELKIRDSGVFSTLDQLLWHPRQKQWLAAGTAPRPAGAKPGTEYIGMYTSKSPREPAAVFSIFREWPRPIPERMAPGAQDLFVSVDAADVSELRLIRYSDRDNEAFPLKFDVTELLPAPVGRKALLAGKGAFLFEAPEPAPAPK